MFRYFGNYYSRTANIYEIWRNTLLRSHIPSGFARTASQAISNVLMPLLLEASDEGGFESLVWHKVHLRSGIYLFKGALTNFHLSQRFDLSILI